MIGRSIRARGRCYEDSSQCCGKTLTATLADNQTSRDFISLLPLTLKLKDYASTEKISYLPRKLLAADAPAGSDPAVGDITYYAPWGIWLSSIKTSVIPRGS
jgi:hypothetical protein